jgi:hypothetical protein
MTTRAGRTVLTTALWAGLALGTGGCELIAIGQAARGPADVEPINVGLAKQSVAIVVWLDEPLRMDWPRLRYNVAMAVKTALATAKSKDLEGARYIDPGSVVRYQSEHPELETMTVEDVAARLGATRVLYIEIGNFQTRSVTSVDLFRGTITATLKVLVVNSTNSPPVAKVVHEYSLQSDYPKEKPEGSDEPEDTVYDKTVSAFADSVAKLFYTHEAEEN